MLLSGVPKHSYTSVYQPRTLGFLHGNMMALAHTSAATSM